MKGEIKVVDEFETSPTLEGLQAAFGITPDETPDETPTQDPAPAEPAPETEPAEHSEEGSPAEGEPSQPNNAGAAQQFQQNRQQQANQAFARMRTENAAMLKTLQSTAKILGIDPRLPPDQLSIQIQKQANVAIAKKNNIDPQLLQRLDQLEEINARYQREEQTKQITAALSTIRERFGATEDDLTVFVQTLDAENYDPFAPGANLVSEFIQRNFDTIMKNAVDSAVRAEQERSSRAGGASKPDSKSGQEDKREPKEVTTQRGFDEFMDSLVN